MLRQTLIAASESDTLRHVASDFGPARRVAMRFVAGEDLDDALRVAGELDRRGMAVSLDYLGEAVEDVTVAEAARDTYRTAIQRMAAAGIDGSVSLKPSQLGMSIGYEVCRGLIADVCGTAADAGHHVTIDMEASDLTQATVDLVLDLRGAGHDNVGCAVQAYLYRTEDDVETLLTSGASLRLCKGAYAEPPDIAYQDARDVDASYARLAERLLTSGHYPRIATHDHRLVHHTKNLARRYELDPDEFEFQMLFGVREPLQERLVAEGHRMRVYVPFGGEWYPYFVRRIAERPANLAFFLRALAGSRARRDGQRPTGAARMR